MYPETCHGCRRCGGGERERGATPHSGTAPQHKHGTTTRSRLQNKQRNEQEKHYRLSTKLDTSHLGRAPHHRCHQGSLTNRKNTNDCSKNLTQPRFRASTGREHLLGGGPGEGSYFLSKGFAEGTLLWRGSSSGACWMGR